MKFLDPRNDIAFRKIFGEHKVLCISLLNALLPLPADGLIEDLEYCDPSMFPSTPGEKNSVVDVSCKDSNGRQFLVEMQLYWTQSFMPRALLNSAKAYARQTRRGMDFSELQPVYSLCLLNDVFLRDDCYAESFRHVYTIRDEEFPNLVMDGMTFVFVELPKFRSVNRAHNKMTELWLKFLNETGDKTSRDDMDPELTSNALISQALDIVEESSFSGADRDSYEKEWDAISVRVSSLNDAVRRGELLGLQKGEKLGLQKGEKLGLEKGEKLGLEKGEKLGLEKGEKLGLEKGEKLGLEKGEKLGLEKGEKLGLEKGEKLGLEKGEKLGLEKGEKLGLEKGEKLGLEKGEKLGLEKGEKLGILSVARKMKEMGIPKEQIQQATGLTLADIEEA